MASDITSVAAVVNVTTAEALDELIASTDKLVIDFYKFNCQPCKAVSLLFDRYAATNPGVVLAKVSLDDVGVECFKTYGVRSTPTISFFRAGEQVSSSVGFMTTTMFESMIDTFFL